MAPMYYRGAHAALLVYDITSQESFEELTSWIEGKEKKLFFIVRNFIVYNFIVNIFMCVYCRA